jgi:UTP--glucose-1-phosphate uridylyltransferase
MIAPLSSTWSKRPLPRASLKLSSSHVAAKRRSQTIFDAHYELEHRLEKKGKQTILGTVKNIMPDHVTVTSVRQSDALGQGHAVLCAKHLLNNEPFAVLLPDVLVLDQASREPTTALRP